MPLAMLAACSTGAWLAGWLASRCLGGSSPATRHLVWLLVFVITAAGMLAAFLPWRWHWAVLPPAQASILAEAASPSRADLSSVTPTTEPLPPAPAKVHREGTWVKLVWMGWAAECYSGWEFMA